MLNFVLIGAAGYVAPKHLKAIKEVGGNLIACTDPHDSVGILDSYFPECQYFNTWERFDRFCNQVSIDYIVVCSPNYLHETHIRWGLKLGADIICEKPLALTSHNLMVIEEAEFSSRGKVNVILQLRLVERLINLRKVILNNHIVSLRYITPRGKWYHYSWKGDESKSGGLATNIGIHLFDLLGWLFGKYQDVKISEKTKDTVVGMLVMEKAEVNFILSVQGKVPERLMVIDGELIDFNVGFTNLHTKSYEQILLGYGFGIEDARSSINICERIRGINLD